MLRRSKDPYHDFTKRPTVRERIESRLVARDEARRRTLGDSDSEPLESPTEGDTLPSPDRD